MPSKKYKTIFFGTPDFAVPVLEKIITLPYLNLAAIVTQPDKPVGRRQTLTPPAVKILAQKHRLPTLQPEKIKTEEFEVQIKQLNPDVIILVAYGKIIPKNLLSIPKYGWLNLHASLLPKLRGASPIQHAILQDESMTGVTLMKMNEGMDTGPIISQEKINIVPEENSQTLHDKLSRLSAEVLKKYLLSYLEGKLKPEQQDNSQSTYTKIIGKEDGKIDWQKSAMEIERQIRAFKPWPGAWCFWPRTDKHDYDGQDNNNKLIEARIKITAASVLNPHISCADNTQLGKTFLTAAGKIAVTCGKGSLLIVRLQLEGKKEMDAAEFLRGYLEIANTKLE